MILPKSRSWSSATFCQGSRVVPPPWAAGPSDVAAPVPHVPLRHSPGEPCLRYHTFTPWGSCRCWRWRLCRRLCSAHAQACSGHTRPYEHGLDLTPAVADLSCPLVCFVLICLKVCCFPSLVCPFSSDGELLCGSSDARAMCARQGARENARSQ